MLQGTVRDDSTGAAIGGSWIVLLFSMCRTVTDAAGRFRFDLPAMAERVDAGRPGYRRFKPIPVAVAAGQTTEIELRLRPGGPIEDCRVDARCAPLFREPMLPDGTEEEQFRLAAYAAATAIAWQAVAHEPRWIACFDEPSARVFEEFRKRYGSAARAAECQYPTLQPDPQARLKHLLTGTPAFHLRIGEVEQTGTAARRVTLSYGVGPLFGEGWTCNFQRVRGTWRPVLCVGVWEA